MVAQRDLTEHANPGGGRSAALLTIAAAVYFAARKVVEGSTEQATRNAARLVRFEKSIGLDIEQGIQQLVLPHSVLVSVCNRTYVWLHWPFLIVALLVVFKRDRRAYQRLTGALILSGILGVVIFATFPVSPPRFSPEFVGTVSQAERQHFIRYPAEWSNRLASMPSFHAGWTLIAAIVLSTTLRSRIAKLVALMPGPLVAVAVIATGNHYVLDVLVGTALALGALAVVTWRPATEPLRTRPRIPTVGLRHHADLHS
jgi:membrane-associated phospholipid phosphatase